MIYNDLPYNILVSYAFAGKDEALCEMLFNASQAGKINVMIDSGAFSKHNAKKIDLSHINVRDYCSFLHRYGDKCEKYVMLDKVGDAAQSRKNYEMMLADGLNPMWVATMFDNDFDYMAAAVERNRDICVAGGATTKGPWMMQRFQRVYKNTGEVARIHGLAFVTIPDMFRAPIASVDSSSWSVQASKYGWLYSWDERIHNTQKVHWRDAWRTQKIPVLIQKDMEGMGITKRDFFIRKNHTTEQSIEVILSIKRMILMQRYAKRHGRDLFAAVMTRGNLRNYLWCLEHFNELDYHEFAKL